MTLFVSFFLFLFLICFSRCDQLCIDQCQFDQRFQSTFTLPERCKTIQQNQCSVRLIFDYIQQTVNIDFNSALSQRTIVVSGETETIVHSVINLEDNFIEQTVEFSCSTADSCDADYVRNKALLFYSWKQCDQMREQLIKDLHPNATSTERVCFVDETTTTICDTPCSLDYGTSGSTARSCGGPIDLAFETRIRQSTPISKPEDGKRPYLYACTSESCNGLIVQGRIEKLISEDGGRCLISLNDTVETPTTTRRTNRGATFSTSWIRLVFICLTFFVSFLIN